MIDEANRALGTRFFAAFNRRDFAAIIALLSPDFQLRDQASGTTVTGSQGLLDWLSDVLEAFEDAVATVQSIVLDGNSIAAQAKICGTHTGMLRSPLGEIPSTGGRCELTMAHFFTVCEGRIASIDVYYDVFRIMSQLGLV